MPTLAELLTLASQAKTPTSAARHYREAFRQAFVGSREHVEAGEGLGRALEKLDFSAALAHYMRILDDDIGGLHRYIYERIPIMAEEIGDYELALRVILQAVQRRAPTGVTFRRRAWRLAEAAGRPRPFVPLRLSQWRQAERRAELFWYYAEMARDRRAWSLAARRYGRVAPDSGRYGEAQTWRGHCLEQVLRVEEAIAAYERATAFYVAGYRRDPAYATVVRKSFDRLIGLYEWRGELERALEVVQSALETARQKPPAAWWGRATRIAEGVGVELDREAWEAAFKTPQERLQGASPADHSDLTHEFADELRRLRAERNPPSTPDEMSGSSA